MIIRTTTRSFLLTESPNKFIKLPSRFDLNWSTASAWIGISPILFGTMGATTDFASLGCKSTKPIKADLPSAAMEQWSLSPLIYNFTWMNTKKEEKKILCELMYLTKYATGAEMIPRRWRGETLKFGTGLIRVGKGQRNPYPAAAIFDLKSG